MRGYPGLIDTFGKYSLNGFKNTVDTQYMYLIQQLINTVSNKYSYEVEKGKRRRVALVGGATPQGGWCLSPQFGSRLI